jgi:hypothetical protein
VSVIAPKASDLHAEVPHQPGQPNQAGRPAGPGPARIIAQAHVVWAMKSGQDRNIVLIGDLMTKSPPIIDTPAHPPRAPRLTDDANPVGRATQEGP